MTTADYPILDAAPDAEAALATLPLPMRRWFLQHFGEPTDVQRLAWSAVARYEHVLISSATGTGKTLAAMVPVLADVLSRDAGGVVALVVAPLKALLNDAARSLDGHLDDLREFLPADSPEVTFAVRTGDSSSDERRRLRSHPPHVVYTTPESLAVLLSQPWARELFAPLRWVIVDEIHSLVADKRGADLAVSLERLAVLARQPFRRLGLSATAAPLTLTAAFLAGNGRTCAVVRGSPSPAPDLRVEPLDADGRFLGALTRRIARELPSFRSTLIFTNTRALAERLSWHLRRTMPELAGGIMVHHSALSAPRRREVETRFKRGELRAVVSSTSLELGIDIGTVDLAVLVHTPGDVVRLLQRVGRAGHEPGGLRRGLILTASPAQLLEAAVTCASSRSGQCEPLTAYDAPLDVLCQQLLGMCCERSVEPAEAYGVVRRSTPFADLSRQDFDDAVRYLLGQDSSGVNRLPARLGEDGDCLRILDAKTARLVRQNLGTILGEDNVPVLVRQESAAPPADPDDPLPAEVPTFRVGEVEEAFVDRLKPGDRFLLDGRCLEFRRRESEGAVVDEVPGRPQTPVWTGDGRPLSSQLARRLFALRQQAAEALRDGPEALRHLLREQYHLEGYAVDLLAGYFQEQESVSEIPGVSTLLVETVPNDRGTTVTVHTPLNRAANDALTRVAAARMTADGSTPMNVVVADLGFSFVLRRTPPMLAERLREWLTADDFSAALDDALDASETLRGRFAKVAQTGLMLLRNPAGRKQKVGGRDWAGRRLFRTVADLDADFVLIRQARREVRSSLCDAETAREYAGSLPRLTVRIRQLFKPSPFAAAWTQSDAITEADTSASPADALAALHAELMGGL